MQLEKLFKNTCHPLCKSADCAEIKQKLRGAHAIFQYKIQKICVRDPVSQKRKQKINDIDPDIYALPSFQKRFIKPHRTVPYLIDPALQPENTDILRILSFRRNLSKIRKVFLIFFFLFPMAVSPFPNPFIDKISCRSQSCHNTYKQGT